jgi:transposase InsO family protein
VSRSGFYDYQLRQAHPKIDAEEVALLARVKAIAATTRSSYGSRRMAKALQAEGFAVGRVKARRLMKEAGVQVRRPKRRTPVTTDSRHGYEVAPNLLSTGSPCSNAQHRSLAHNTRACEALAVVVAIRTLAQVLE